MKKQKKSFKSIIFTTITILIITNILLGAYDFVWHGLNRRKATQWYWYGYAYCPKYSANRTKACLFNITQLTAALEMYFMDHDTMLSELDTDKLIEEGYLKSEIRPPESKCKYFIAEDLFSENPIRCEFHGNKSEIIKKLEKEKREFERNITIYNVCIRILPALIYFIYAIIAL